MVEYNGWVLPTSDKYFEKFITNSAVDYKSNGFQREHLEKAFEHVKAWNVAIDVGAHVGFWAHDMAQKFTHVHCFEAAPDTFKCLKLNMREHENVTLYNVAVGDKKGKAQLGFDPAREAQGNTGSRFVQPVKSGDLDMIALDDLSIAACDLLKIDVEGFEEMVLRGAEKVLADHPVVILETDKHFAAKRYRLRNRGAISFLEERGFRQVAHMRPDRIFVHG